MLFGNRSSQGKGIDSVVTHNSPVEYHTPMSRFNFLASAPICVVFDIVPEYLRVSNYLMRSFINEHSIALWINWMDPEALDSASLEWWFLHLSWTTQLRLKYILCLIIKSYSYSANHMSVFFLPQRLDAVFFFLPQRLDLSSLTGLEYALKPKLISINTKEEIIPW